MSAGPVTIRDVEQMLFQIGEERRAAGKPVICFIASCTEHHPHPNVRKSR